MNKLPKKITLQEVSGKLTNQEPFEAGNMRAFYDDEGAYVVTSYHTVIARDRWLSSEIFSSSTSRHQNLCRKHLYF